MLVEGKDLSFLRQFHALLFPDAETPLDALPSIALGGWGGWSYAIGSSMALKNAVGDRIMSYCILDSDYHTSGEKVTRYREAGQRGIQLHIWSCKEIENYLLNPEVIARLIRDRLKSGNAPSADEIRTEMLATCEREKDTIVDGIAACLMSENRGLGVGVNRLAREQLNSTWQNLEARLRVVSGKSVLSELTAWSHQRYGVSFGANAVAKKFRRQEVPEEIKTLLSAIELGHPFV